MIFSGGAHRQRREIATTCLLFEIGSLLLYHLLMELLETLRTAGVIGRGCQDLMMFKLNQEITWLINFNSAYALQRVHLPDCSQIYGHELYKKLQCHCFQPQGLDHFRRKECQGRTFHLL